MSIGERGRGSSRTRRSPQFWWDESRGCGLGVQCDDVVDQERVETIVIPDTLWSDLPTVYVTHDWEPMSAFNVPRSVSRCVAETTKTLASHPPRVSLQWDMSPTIAEDAARELGHVANIHHESPQKSLGYPSQTSGLNNEDSVLSEAETGTFLKSGLPLPSTYTPGNDLNVPPPSRLNERRAQLPSVPSFVLPGDGHSELDRKAAPRVPMSKTGDAECLPLEMGHGDTKWNDIDLLTMSELPNQCQLREGIDEPCSCAPDKRNGNQATVPPCL